MPRNYLHRTSNINKPDPAARVGSARGRESVHSRSRLGLSAGGGKPTPMLHSEALVLGVLLTVIGPACLLPSFNPLGIPVQQETGRKTVSSSPRPSANPGAAESATASDAVLEVGGTVITSAEVLAALPDAPLTKGSRAWPPRTMPMQPSSAPSPFPELPL